MSTSQPASHEIIHLFIHSKNSRSDTSSSFFFFLFYLGITAREEEEEGSYCSFVIMHTLHI
jgi:hypothetical protein